MNIYVMCFLIALCIVSFTVALLLKYKEERLKKQLEQHIKSLSKDDFNIVNEIKSGAVNVYHDPENSSKRGDGIEFTNRKLDLDGEIKVGMVLPLYSIRCSNDDILTACKWNEITGVNTHIRISERQYSEYLDLVEGCDIAATTSFYMEIKLSDKDVIALIDKWNKHYSKTDIVTKYEFERYNVLNLITDMKPFSDEEISDLIDKIKDRMIEILHI